VDERVDLLHGGPWRRDGCGYGPASACPPTYNGSPIVATVMPPMEEVRLDLRADANHAILWRDGDLYLLDQRVLPQDERYVRCRDAAGTAAAIRAMVVRGAPAIGIAAAYGVALAARQRYVEEGEGWKAVIEPDLQGLADARPTAVNLFWALDRMRSRIAALPDGDDPSAALLAEAQAIHAQDVIANRVMGDLGAALIAGPTDVITHCNTGGLATGGHGTALGVIRSAWAEGRIARVYADETRPWLQGARLTAWELERDGIPVSLMVDGAAAARMARGGIGWAIVGADRIAANGDTANKIGTYGLAVAARHHGVKFMVAAPTATIDRAIASGAEIPIEERDPGEVLLCAGRQVGAAGVGAWNPVFDVTPAALIDAIVTERGVVLNPTAERVAALFDA
jgi:methylthioribose-1-phosphate isomerase